MPHGHDDPDDSDAPQDIDLDWPEDDEDEADTCPSCARRLFPGLDHCPACGHWLTGGSSVSRRRASGWLWPVAVAVLIAIILVVWHGLR